MNWYFDGSNINKDKTTDEQNMEVAKTLRGIYNCMLSVGFTKTEAMQIIVGMVEGAARGGKK